jgi:hypothetical protein
MRPVEKWAVGQHGVKEDYKPYGKAKEKLLENFGHAPYYYCNYCDRKVPKVNLEVEHILPKKYPKNSHLETKWINFLLGCKNCNLAKKDRDIELNDHYWPHIHNTLKLFTVNNDGTIGTKVGLTIAEKTKAINTIELIGLNRGYSHPKRQPQDDRYEEREKVLRIAERKELQRRRGMLNDDDIVELAVSNGFWIVWMQVFEGYPNILQRLVNEFKHTFTDCLKTGVQR